MPLTDSMLECTGCGALTHAVCDCGMTYLPKFQRARVAIEASPEKSDRAIAAELGVSPMTVGRVRSTVTSGTVAKRIGLDGKTRSLPQIRATQENPFECGDEEEECPFTVGDKRPSAGVQLDRLKYEWSVADKKVRVKFLDWIKTSGEL